MNEYLFKTYNGNKYILPFDESSTVQSAIDFFQNEYVFKDVNIYSIGNKIPNFKTDKTKLLKSFPSRIFLLCARYGRNSEKYEKKNLIINNECYIRTPLPNRNIEKNRKKNNLLIQQFNNLMEDNPNIFDEVLEIAKKTDQTHYELLSQKKEKIKELLKNSKEELDENISKNKYRELIIDNSDS